MHVLLIEEQEASNANIGCAATPIRNPQNLAIVVQSGISFGQFVFDILLSTLAGCVIDAGILLGLYWNQLDGGASPLVDQRRSSPCPPKLSRRTLPRTNSRPATISHLLLCSQQRQRQ